MQWCIESSSVIGSYTTEQKESLNLIVKFRLSLFKPILMQTHITNVSINAANSAAVTDIIQTHLNPVGQISINAA